MSIDRIKPKFYPRAQFTGVLRWACPYCAHVNEHTLRPGLVRTKCRDCRRRIWWGWVCHIPASGNTTLAKDGTIPTWADDEYSFDPLKFDPMPPAIFDPEKPIRQRGRVHMMLIHDNVYATEDDLPQTVGDCDEAPPKLAPVEI